MSTVKEENYWRDAGLLPAFPDPPPRQTEILVVGSGYTGTTAAIRLHQAGREVTIIDARPLGSGASARNGGMVLNGLSADAAAVVRRCGLAAARRLFRESTAAASCRSAV